MQQGRGNTQKAMLKSVSEVPLKERLHEIIEEKKAKFSLTGSLNLRYIQMDLIIQIVTQRKKMKAN